MIKYENLTKGKYDLENKHISGDIVIENDGVILFGGEINGNVTVKAAKAFIKDCKINGNVIFESASHSILAKCDVRGDIIVKNSYNSVVLLNNAQNAKASGNTNLYVVENTLLGALCLEKNNYLLADENICASISALNNENTNGGNITDINSRLEFGADERLLPHPNKELFIGVERDEYISAPDSSECEHINEYIMRGAVGGKTVIVPPGAYVSPAPIKLGAESSGAKIYAYGALQEMIPYGNAIVLEKADDITIKGLVTSYSGQPCGQLTVLEEIDERTLLVLPYAGCDGEFGKTDITRFSHTYTDLFEPGLNYPYGGMGGAYTLDKNDDGTYIMHLTEKNSKIGKIHKGHRIVCRLVGPDKVSIRPFDSKSFIMKDTFLYCHSACLAMSAHGECEGILLDRWFNGREAARIIDKETYDRYRAYEEKYGIEGEVYIDEKGRYRGGTPLYCSSDATHIHSCTRGTSAVSCLFEGMCDDGSNQRSSSARLKSITDNGDGTSTLIYHGNVAEVYCLHFFNESAPVHYTASCQPFKKGHRILVYTSTGVTVCDTRCLCDEELLDVFEFSLYPPERNPRHYTDRYRRLTVKTEDVNFKALEGFDLDDNGYELKEKVLVDNLDRNSAGFVFDNVLICDMRSRGILVKTVDATIKNCTFRNLAHTGILLSNEFVWGESSVSQDIGIKRCLFDNLGFFNYGFFSKTFSPIAIKGLSSTVSEDSLLYKNITIEGNKFINNRNEHFITVNSAQNVRIANNVFEDSGELSHIDGRIIDIETAMNIEISGNTYPEYLNGDETHGIAAKNFKNIYGDDISLMGDIE